MDIYINKNLKVNINKIIIKEKYIIKKYDIKYGKTIKKLCMNEIKINKILLKNKYIFSPKLILISNSDGEISLYFERKIQYHINKRLSNFRKLLYVIKKLHDIKICHNDLNLSNIIFTKNKVYLIDFAMATSISYVNIKYDIKSLELIARKIFCNNDIYFTKDNMKETIEEWSLKYEPIFKKRTINKK